MNHKIIKHFDYLTPFDEASNDEELAKIMRLKYPKACSSLEVDAGFFSRMVEDVQKYKAWRVIGFESFEAFCEQELGKTLDEVNNIVHGVNSLRRQGVTGPISESQALGQHGGDRRSEQAKENQGYNVTLKQERGNRSEYLQRRIKRDAPEVFEQLKAGEFKSVRQAAIAAGVLKVKPRLETIKASAAKLSLEERNELIAYLKCL